MQSLPFPVALEGFDYWANHPPVHLLLRMGLEGWGMKFRNKGQASLTPAESDAVAFSNVIPFDQIPEYVRNSTLFKKRKA